MTNDKQDDMKEFEEEFDFESEEPSTDALSSEEETLDSPKNTPASNRASEGVAIDRKPSKLPLLIGLVAASFIGWQGYKMMFGQPKDDLTVTEKQEAKPKTSKPTTTPTTLPDTAQHQPNKTTTTAPAAIISTPPGGNTVPSNMNTTSTPHHQPDLFTAPQIIPQQAAALTTPAPAAKPGQLETIEDSLKKSQERMNKLESKFSELMDSMGSLNQGMGQVTRELSTINDSVQKLNKDVKTLKSQAIQPIAAPQTQEIRQQPELDNNKYENIFAREFRSTID